MTIWVIELNDSEIRVARGNEIVLRSPGYAFIDNDKIEVGATAAKQARLHPRAAHNRYWKNLNQDPLQYPSPRARHNADLAFAQLLAIHEQAGKPEEVIFAVPGSYSREQLALLLGLVEASPLTAVGLVDTAVAATAAIAGEGNYVHIDIHLHQTILTRIHVSEQVSRSSVQLIDGVGLSTIYDSSAHLIADLFIKESRFDPQHHPETEQALYNQIPACLHSLQTHAEVSLEIQYQQTQYQAKLSADALLQVLRPGYQKIVDAVGTADVCLISDQLAHLPGLTTLLGESEALSPTVLFEACQKHAAIICSSGSALNFVTSLPAASDPVITEIRKQTHNDTEPAADGQSITHILHGHNAYPLNKERLYLTASGVINVGLGRDSHCSISQYQGRFQLQPEGELTVFVNGQQLQQSTQVEAGDIISFVGSKTEYTFIHVSN
jgi:hypothetical protein